MKRIAFKNLFPITCKHALILKIPYNIFLWENYQAELFWSIDNGNNTPKETTILILGPYVKIIFALNNCNASFFCMWYWLDESEANCWFWWRPIRTNSSIFNSVFFYSFLLSGSFLISMSMSREWQKKAMHFWSSTVFSTNSCLEALISCDNFLCQLFPFHVSISPFLFPLSFSFSLFTIFHFANTELFIHSP